MNLIPGTIKGVHRVALPSIFTDNRGSLARLYDKDVFVRLGFQIDWIQQSLSTTPRVNVLRGLHFQRPPYAERKLIIALSGEMLWVVVDIRKESPTFGQWEGHYLSTDKTAGLFIDTGFAHGCLSVKTDCVLLINADNVYSPEHGGGIIWNDSELGIDWPLDGNEPVASEEHLGYPDFNHFRESL